MTLTGSVRLSYHEDQRITLKTTPSSSSSSSSSSSPHDDPITTNQDQPLSSPTPPLFTPIWDYEKFPVGPCVRERDRVSQEVQQALLSSTTSGTKYKGEDLVRGSSFPGVSSNNNAPHRRYGSRSGGSVSYSGGVGRVSRHGSRHGSRTISSQSIPSSPTRDGFGPLSVVPSSPTEGSTTLITTTQPSSPTSPVSGSVNFVTSPSKFDQIKAQMERVRSIRVSTTTHSSSSSSSSSGHRMDPPSKVSPMPSSPILYTQDAKTNKKKGIFHQL
ncbi:hypothetical protein CPC16_011987, partial [Podila verticillata]